MSHFCNYYYCSCCLFTVILRDIYFLYSLFVVWQRERYLRSPLPQSVSRMFWVLFFRCWASLFRVQVLYAGQTYGLFFPCVYAGSSRSRVGKLIDVLLPEALGHVVWNIVPDMFLFQLCDHSHGNIKNTGSHGNSNLAPSIKSTIFIREEGWAPLL